MCISAWELNSDLAKEKQISSVVSKQGLTLCVESVREVSGIQTITALASAMIACVGKAFSEMPQGVTTFVQRLEDCSSVLSIFSFVSYLQWWTSETPKEEQNWQYTASMVCSTAQQVMDIAYFLEGTKLLDLSKLAATIGRIPVLDTVYQTFSLGGSVFYTWHDGLKYSRLKEELLEKKAELKKVQEEFGECRNACNKGGREIEFKVRSKLLEEYITPAQQKVISRQFANNAERQLIKYTKQNLVHRILKLETEVSNKTLEITKNKISLINNITSVAYGILALVGILANVGFLSVVGWPMLTLALVSAGIGLYEYLYDKKNPEVAMPTPHSLVAFVDNLITYT